MKIKLGSLPPSLPFKAFCLIASDEVVLANEARNTIWQTCSAQGFSNERSINIQSDADWQQLQRESEAFSLFDEKKLITIKVSTGKITKVGAQAIQCFLEEPPEHLCIILLLGKVTPAMQRSAWFKAIDEQGIVATHTKLTPVDRLHWIKQRLAKASLQADENLLQLIADYTQGNLLAAEQEIEKLALLYPEGTLTREQIIQAITDHSRYSVFDLVDAWLCQPSHCQKILMQLQSEGMAPTLVIWGLAREIRTLAQLAFAIELHDRPLTSDLFRECNVWQQRQSMLKAHLQQYRLKNYHAALKQLAYMDKLAKGVIRGDIWQTLQHFCAPTRLIAA